jgi:hypothetical protein
MSTKATRSGAFLLLAILCFPGAGFAQSPNHGTIEGNTYIDARFGMRYTFPAHLRAQTSLNGMPVGTGEKQGSSEFLLDAMEDATGRVRSGVFITTDPVGSFGAKGVPDFLQAVAKRGMGAKEPVEVRDVAIAGRRFYRSDVGIGSPVHAFGAQVGTICNDHFLVFYFSAASAERVDDLVRTMSSLQLSCSEKP